MTDVAAKRVDGGVHYLVKQDGYEAAGLSSQTQ